MHVCPSRCLYLLCKCIHRTPPSTSSGKLSAIQRLATAERTPDLIVLQHQNCSQLHSHPAIVAVLTARPQGLAWKPRTPDTLPGIQTSAQASCRCQLLTRLRASVWHTSREAAESCLVLTTRSQSIPGEASTEDLVAPAAPLEHVLRTPAQLTAMNTSAPHACSCASHHASAGGRTVSVPATLLWALSTPT